MSLPTYLPSSLKRILIEMPVVKSLKPDKSAFTDDPCGVVGSIEIDVLDVRSQNARGGGDRGGGSNGLPQGGYAPADRLPPSWLRSPLGAPLQHPAETSMRESHTTPLSKTTTGDSYHGN